MEYHGYALVSKQLFEEYKKVGWMYREEPDNETDSGWRFFSGHEEEEYANKAENLMLVALSSVVELDSSIEPFLNSEVKTAFERNENNELVKLENYNFDENQE